MPKYLANHQVVVVGAGVIGASIAYHAAASGLEVTLLDSQLPAAGATQHSFGWIRPIAGSETHANGLWGLIREDFNRLHRDVPAVSVNWCGALVWGEHFGTTGDRIGLDATSVEPNLRHTPPEARLNRSDGVVDPVALAENLVEAAQNHGAEVLLGQQVDDLLIEDGAVVGVRAAERIHTAATVVVAAGVASSSICAGAGIALPLQSSPAIMVRFRAEPGLISHVIANDDFEVRQLADGTLLVPIDYEGQTSRNALEATAESTRQQLLRSFTVAGGLALLRVDVGWRPMPVDERLIVGPVDTVPGLYVCVVHPGIALAPTIGRLVAEELSTGIPPNTLMRLRVSQAADIDLGIHGDVS